MKEKWEVVIVSESVGGTYLDIVRRGLDGGLNLGSTLMDVLSGVCIRFQM